MTTNPIINPQPNYSGVTIQITNPAVYACGGKYNEGTYSRVGESYTDGQYIGVNKGQYYNAPNLIGQGYREQSYIGNNEESGVSRNGIDNRTGIGSQNSNVTNPNRISANSTGNVPVNYNPEYAGAYAYGGSSQGIQGQQYQGQAYPAQYYLNNYNYQNNGLDNNEKLADALNNLAQKNVNSSQDSGVSTNISPVNPNDYSNTKNAKTAEDYMKMKDTDTPQDFTKSQAVISDLDARAAAEEAEKKNCKQKRVVALTDEYIKSLENYLNNPNNEIRLMASKEILTRLDEDKDRYNDAALNALLNKMLQDPSKLIRVAALSAFASQLASGNDYTVSLLHNIQQNPNADKEDVLQAADILLKMSAGTEIKNIPNPAVKEQNEVSKG